MLGEVETMLGELATRLGRFEVPPHASDGVVAHEGATDDGPGVR